MPFKDKSRRSTENFTRPVLLGMVKEQRKLIKDLRNKIFYLERVPEVLKEKRARKRGKTKYVIVNYEKWEKSFGLDKIIPPSTYMEIIQKAIWSYDLLVTKGIVTMNELGFLIVATRKEVFTLIDLKDAFAPFGRRWRSDFNKCVEAGYFTTEFKKKNYHLTYIGKKRFEDIVNYI